MTRFQSVMFSIGFLCLCAMLLMFALWLGAEFGPRDYTIPQPSLHTVVQSGPTIPPFEVTFSPRP